MQSELLSSDESQDQSSATGEVARFESILERHIAAKDSSRHDLRETLVEYIKFTKDPSVLIGDLIQYCISLPIPERLEIAIDVLAKCGKSIFDYAEEFLFQDIKSWKATYRGRAYEPNDDYWFILLRSVARIDLNEVSEDKKLTFIRMCRGACYRGVVEGVIAALIDIGSDAAKKTVKELAAHSDPFIAGLADEALSEF